jgi:hypothetical protein
MAVAHECTTSNIVRAQASGRMWYPKPIVPLPNAPIAPERLARNDQGETQRNNQECKGAKVQREQ